jgi:hypothetical protein
MAKVAINAGFVTYIEVSFISHSIVMAWLIHNLLELPKTIIKLLGDSQACPGLFCFHIMIRQERIPISEWAFFFIFF